MFFFISGYLFFYRKDAGERGFYTSQWRKRLRTLLVPYVLWNIFALALVLIKCYGPVSHLFPRMAANPVSLRECIGAFWAFRPDDTINVYEPASAPVDIPLWFIRDLMVMMLFTPLFRILLRPAIGIIFPIGLLALFISGKWFACSSGCSLTAVTFFVGGAWFSLHRIDPAAMIRRIGSPGICAAVSVVLYAIAASFELNDLNSGIGLRLHGLTISIGMLMTIAVVCYIATHTRRSIPSTLTASSFFIYGFHQPVLIIIIPLIGKYVKLQSNPAWLLCYFGLIIFAVALSVFCFVVCRKISPKFTALLTGSRHQA